MIPTPITPRLRGALRGRMALSMTLALCALGSSGHARAATFSLDNGIEGNFDSTLSFGMQVRARGADCRFLGYDNGGCAPYQLDADAGFLNSDDGNLNYGRGQIFSAAARGLFDLAARAPGGWSGLLRVSAFYDVASGHTDRTDIEDLTIGVRQIEVLDAYVAKNFDLGERPSRVRIGYQALTWGEAILTFGGINDINPLDLRKAFSAGVQMKELFRPTPMLYFSTSVTDRFGLEGYYQAGFQEHTLPASGTLFSPFDFASPGGQWLYVGTPSLDTFINGPTNTPNFPRGTLGDNGTTTVYGGQRFSGSQWANPATNPAIGDNGAVAPLGLGTALPRGSDFTKTSGQFGLAGRYNFEESGDELGLYYIRYNEKLPALAWTAGGPNATFALGYSTYNINYVPNRDLYGISYNTRAGDWSLGMELSYRPNQVVTIDQSVPVPGTGNPYACDGFGLPAGTVCPGYIETPRYQATINGLSILKPQSFGGLVGMLGASDGLMIAEFTVSTLPKLDLTPAGPGQMGSNTTVTTMVPYLNNYDFAAPTRTTTGFSLSASLTYPNAFGMRASLTPEIGWNQGLSGVPATFFPGYGKGVGSVTLALNVDFKLQRTTVLRIDYTNFYGGGQGNPLLDKDYIGLSLVTSF
jgi:hypothetical protein